MKSLLFMHVHVENGFSTSASTSLQCTALRHWSNISLSTEATYGVGLCGQGREQIRPTLSSIGYI